MDSDLLLVKVLISVTLGFLGGWIVKAIIASGRLRREERLWNQKLDACSDARESAARKVRQLRSRCSELESSFARVQGEMTQIRDNMDLREKSVNALRADLFDAKSKIQEVDALRTKLAERDQKLIELNKARVELTAQAIDTTEMESMRAELDVLSGRATQLETENAALLAERAQLVHDLEESREAAAAIPASPPPAAPLDRSAAASSATHQGQSGAELAGLQRKLSQRDAVIEKLRKDLDASRQHLSSFQQRLHQMESNSQRGNGGAPVVQPDRQRPKAPSRIESPAAEPEANPDQYDDLTRIRGIGAKLQTTLNQLGVFRFEQLAGMSEAELESLASQLNSFQNRPFRDDWISQARKLLADAGTSSGQ